MPEVKPLVFNRHSLQALLVLNTLFQCKAALLPFDCHCILLCIDYHGQEIWWNRKFARVCSTV